MRRQRKQVIIYEPMVEVGKKFFESVVIGDLKKFKELSDNMVANKYEGSLNDMKEKVYKRDLYGRDCDQHG